MTEVGYRRLKITFWWAVAFNVALNLFVGFEFSEKFASITSVFAYKHDHFQSPKSSVESLGVQERIAHIICAPKSVIGIFPNGENSILSLFVTSGLTIPGSNKLKQKISGKKLTFVRLFEFYQPELLSFPVQLHTVQFSNFSLVFLIRTGRLGPLIV